MFAHAITNSFAIIKNKSGVHSLLGSFHFHTSLPYRNGTVDVFINLNTLFGRESVGVNAGSRGGELELGGTGEPMVGNRCESS